MAPNWYATVMGTGIVANAALLLPHRSETLHDAAFSVWCLAATLLAGLVVATALRWREFLAHARNPAMVPFYGAPPMALMTVGAGSLLLGLPVGIDVVLWTAGTLTGLAAAVAVPYLMFTRHEFAPDSAWGAWLMPVVAPMVSAATGAALIDRLPPGEARLDLLLACGAMFGLSLLAAFVVIAVLWNKLLHHGVGPAALVPTLWIVLGPLGQSITAANLLADVAGLPSFAGVLYGMPVLGFALLWMAIAAAITIRTPGLRFSLTWWSFTFPVGTVVTGTSELARHSGSIALGWLAVALYVFLVGAWLTAATNTARMVADERHATLRVRARGVHGGDGGREHPRRRRRARPDRVRGDQAHPQPREAARGHAL
ncbi:TDT family transporter [Solirubrobacter soli]|uniref:TDT family transporter n=1 Tax=Solirubrobacter soli TaxID=363832 RepID=UPI00041EA262|nr:TDT family transporter [Solirubrobacter soli]